MDEIAQTAEIPSADDDLVNLIDMPGETPEESAPTPKYKIKVFGEEREMTPDDLIERAQKYEALPKKFEDAARELAEAKAERERYSQHQAQLSQHLQALQAQAMLWQSEGMPTQEQMQQLLEESPHEYMKLQARMQQRHQALQQMQAAQQTLMQQQEQLRQQQQKQFLEAEQRKLLDLFPTWKNQETLMKDVQDLNSYAKQSGLDDNDWQALCNSKAQYFSILNKAMQYDRLQERAKQAKKPNPEPSEVTKPVTTVAGAAKAKTPTIWDANISDAEWSRLRSEQRRKRN